MHIEIMRLKPRTDLLHFLDQYLEDHKIKAGVILTCVGSLTRVVLRLANQEEAEVFEGHFEIVSLVGTVSIAGSHLHLSVSDETGRTIGGHLMPGNLIYTTAEIALGIIPGMLFGRELCQDSGYPELVISSQKDQEI